MGERDRALSGISQGIRDTPTRRATVDPGGREKSDETGRGGEVSAERAIGTVVGAMLKLRPGRNHHTSEVVEQVVGELDALAQHFEAHRALLEAAKQFDPGHHPDCESRRPPLPLPCTCGHDEFWAALAAFEEES